jgi:DNA-binding MurR/RpiR family transcriptional regulator
MDFQEQIRKNYDHLSRSYRKVADFLMSDYQAAAFMTAAALADAVGVDTTTVVRFAQRLGFPGFPELIDDVQNRVKADLDRQYLVKPENDGLPARVQQLIAEDHKHLESALAQNTPDALETTLTQLRTAQRIVVMGESYAAPLAESFAAMLRAAELSAVYVGGDAYDRAVALADLTHGDMVVGISAVSGPSGLARALSFARSEGAITLACTPSLTTAVARSAEAALCGPGETGGPGFSLVGMYSLCTAIANVLREERPGAIDREAAAAGRAMEILS